MKAITEDFLRVELRNTQPEVYYIPEGKILTPAAREYLQQRKIKVAAGGQPAEPAPAAAPAAQPVVPTVMCAPEPPKPKYVDYETGAYYMEKPEHMTQLFGNVLVAKDGESWYAIGTMAKDLRLSRSTIKRALTELVRQGRVEKQARFRENGGCTSNLYVFSKYCKQHL